jgi:hypothetical protein
MDTDKDLARNTGWTQAWPRTLVMDNGHEHQKDVDMDARKVEDQSLTFYKNKRSSVNFLESCERYLLKALTCQKAERLTF